MSQNDFNLANQGFPAMRADMNSAFQALASNSSGATEPGTTYAYQWWYDETTDILKMRNADDDAWINIASFDQANDTWSPYIGSAQLTATADELNILDGVTATTAELNLLDGITALSGSDTEIVTGTAGTDGQIGKWNADGDLIGVGTNTANGDVVVLEDVSGNPGLPAVDGSQLTGVGGGGATSLAAIDLTNGGADDLTVAPYTGLPSGVYKIVLGLRQVRVSGADDLLVQLSTGTTFLTSGYYGRSDGVSFSTGFEIPRSASNQLVTTLWRFMKEPGSNVWMADSIQYRENAGRPETQSVGEVDLGGTLDGIRLIRGSTGTFDNGDLFGYYWTE